MDNAQQQKEVDQARITLQHIDFVVHLKCRIQENGLGEEVTVHVQDCGLSAPPTLTPQESACLIEKSETLVILALSQALKNADSAVVRKALANEALRQHATPVVDATILKAGEG